MYKLLLHIVFSLLPALCVGQNIAITGTINGADSMTVTVLSEKEVISKTKTAGSVYTIFLGSRSFYEIRFDARNKPPKYLHFFCYGIDKPTTVMQNINFSTQVNMIMWLEKGGRAGGVFQKRRLQYAEPKIFRYYWGKQSGWKEEF